MAHDCDNEEYRHVWAFNMGRRNCDNRYVRNIAAVMKMEARFARSSGSIHWTSEYKYLMQYSKHSLCRRPTENGTLIR